MELSADQVRSLDKIRDWLRARDKPFFYLAGYAGTGKTTLAQHAAENMNGEVLFAAFTGKAALAMMQRGVRQAHTIHSLAYTPIGNDKSLIEDLQKRLESSDLTDAERVELQSELIEAEKDSTRPRFTLNEGSRIKDASLLVLDECSMIDQRIGKDLLSFNVPILVLGDPAQLPPVKGAGFFTDRRPDAFLENIHRQALDNPILRYATMAREGVMIPRGDLGAARHLSKKDLGVEDTVAFEQVLVGFNATRRRINRSMRRHLGRTTVYPDQGDKLVCLRNNHDQGLLNGTLGEALSSHTDLDDDGILLDIRMLTGIEDREMSNVGVLRYHFDVYRDDTAYVGRERLRFNEFDYGYALTVHKAQGSEWGNVLLCDDNFGRSREDRARWLYTAITRARDSLTILS